MAEIPSIPNSKAITPVRDTDTFFTLNPRDAAGAVLDLTGFNAGTLSVWPDNSNLASGIDVPITVSGGGTSGVSVALASGDLDDITDSFGLTRCVYTLSVTDGTDNVKASYGILQV